MIHVSLLSAYLYCPRKLFIQQVISKPEGSKEGDLRAKATESWYALINRADATIVSSFTPDMSVADIESAYAKAYAALLHRAVEEHSEALKTARIEHAQIVRAISRLPGIEAGRRAKNVYENILLHKLTGIGLWQELSPKIKSHYDLSSDALGLNGAVDSIEIYGDRIVPVEYPVGRAPQEGIWPGHQVALAAYMLLIEERFSVGIEKGIVRYADAERELVMNPFLRDKVIATRKKIEALLTDEAIPAIILNENKCRSCNERERCRDENLAGQYRKL
jgi:CRISPR/Cas system-associated exonuclease Cas4 (RecB family)